MPEAIYVEPFPKNKRGDGFKNMASYRTNPHRGVDWSVAGGSKIKAITGGTVMEVGETKVLGNYLIQSTYDGHFILYAHFQVPSTLKQGDKVEAGKTIVGLVGTTGTASTGNHLHVTYGVKQNLITAGMPDLRDLFAVLDAAPKKTVAAKVVTAVKKVVPTKKAQATRGKTMPTYNFKCQDCEKTTQEVRTFDDADKELLCDTCNIPMHKVYSVGAIKFNGGGFYSNDK